MINGTKHLIMHRKNKKSSLFFLRESDSSIIIHEINHLLYIKIYNSMRKTCTLYTDWVDK